MLYSFSVKGWGPFSKRVKIDFTTDKESDRDYHTVKDKNEKIVNRITPIFGFNNSGKSQLISAIYEFRNISLGKREPKELLTYVNNKNKEGIINFEIEFSSYQDENTTYRYVLKIKPDKNTIIDETLIVFKNKKTLKSLSTKDQYYSVQIILNGMIRKEKKYIKQNSSTTFISKINKERGDINSKLDKYGQYQVNCWMVLHDKIRIATPSSSFISNDLDKEKLREYLKKYDETIERITYEDLTNMYSDGERAEIFQIMKKLYPSMNGDLFPMVADSKSGTIKIEDEHISISGPVIYHTGSNKKFLLDQESEGLRRLYETAAIILKDREDYVFIVDELDRKLHPCTTIDIIKKFIEKNAQVSDNDYLKYQQLIFTSHETTLVSNELFDPSEIWIVEKIKDESEIHKISNNCPNIHLLQEANYLNGQYNKNRGHI